MYDSAETETVKMHQGYRYYKYDSAEKDAGTLWFKVIVTATIPITRADTSDQVID